MAPVQASGGSLSLALGSDMRGELRAAVGLKLDLEGVLNEPLVLPPSPTPPGEIWIESDRLRKPARLFSGAYPEAEP